jgi:hypothetical protein
MFLDVDLDGFEDLLIATGNQFDVQDTDTLRDGPHGSASRMALRR